MKYLSTKFEEYINECEKINLHPNKQKLFNSMSDTLGKHNNIILYGPDGVGKYTQALNYIKKFSPTKLKYERKIDFTSNKKQYIFKVSDIHFEIDMELLGCNARHLFNDYYLHIIDILISRGPNNNGIILCKNFEKIHSELLDIFYSYMQLMSHKNIKITYIIITNCVSFIPNNILQRCFLVPFKRPTKGNYAKIADKKFLKNITTNNINNIKDIKSGVTIKPIKDIDLINKIVSQIIKFKKIDFLAMRESIYALLIYNLDIYECMYSILSKLIVKGKLKDQHFEKILFKTYKFLKLYNNNYRPIYHLESFIFYVCIVINEL